MSRKPRILLGCTGSVAALKIPELIDELRRLDNEIDIKLMTTEHATHFFSTEQLQVPIYRDEDEWQMWQKRSDPVLHIELRKWADLFLIAPLDANSLAKIAAGICDNLLLCVTRAWDLKKPLLFAPAMNTLMYKHPLTTEHIEKLKSWGYLEIPSVEKKLVCGDLGIGAMAEVKTIVEAAKLALARVDLCKQIDKDS
ncbi:hypothetical protein LSH36_79g08048 [Paralvinella palmiformis]|uniref:Phosphopantothenoylcysteine decarboxylase n=1 Tax=Paralvinella palmiformis TaxID=53620 RepID=A0AAD9NDR4_9ANNE|nr:hypothetical protein LSH36_79g08048 [Paralvinella palmiformis]